MAGTKPGFMMYHADMRILSKLDADTFKRLIIAMCDYSEYGADPTDLDTTEQVLFEIVRKALDKDNATYNARVKAGTSGGQKSGEARQTKLKQNEAKRSKPKRSEAQPSNANEGEANEPITNNQSPISNSQHPIPISLSCAQENGERENFIPPTLEMVETYAKGTGLRVDARRFIAVQEENGWKDSEGRPIRNWRTWLEGWAARNPVGSEAGREKRSNFLAHPQRTYEEGELDHIYTDLTPYMEDEQSEG